MKTDRLLVWVVRISWPLLGGGWGALAGGGGYHGMFNNADSFGTMFAEGFFIATAIIGLFAGIACGVLTGGLTEKLLRYLGVRTAYALCIATAVNTLVIWQLIGMVQTKYPGFRSPESNPSTTSKPKEYSDHKLQSKNPCEQAPPPANTKERSWWETECR